MNLEQLLSLAELDEISLFKTLPPAEKASLLQAAEQIDLGAGKVLFYEGDATEFLYLLIMGECQVTQGGRDKFPPQDSDLLDPVAVLGELPHSCKITAKTDCRLLRWSSAELWKSEIFSAAARRHLAEHLRRTQTRLEELSAPLHFQPQSAELLTGAFRFENVTMILAVCEVQGDFLSAWLPPDLSLLQRPLKKTSPLLIALAKFPHSYLEDFPDFRFAYTETTFFVPVRHKSAIGLYVPFIYPSTYEPILLGREIYGFPKQLGETVFGGNQVSLEVTGQPNLHMKWESASASSETRLIRALSDWLGIEGRLTAAAFQASEVLRKVTRLPATRRVDVYNRKRIPAADSTHEEPTYAVNQLTRATFGVLRWYHIAKLEQPGLNASGLLDSIGVQDITLREAYRAQLDMRLSTGRVIKDYLTP